MKATCRALDSFLCRSTIIGIIGMNGTDPRPRCASRTAPALKVGEFPLVSAEKLAISWRPASVVQYNTQKRRVDLKAAVVLDESQFPEFVHEEIHA
jgi:hypothetical protein